MITSSWNTSATKVNDVLGDVMTSSDRQRQTLVDSLRLRFARAVADNDADAKAALFKEAVYLGIQPDAFTTAGDSETT